MIKNFSGEGYSQEPFTPEETAVLRELIKSVDDAFSTIDGIVALVRAGVVIFQILKIGIPIGAAAFAIGAYGSAKGLF